jgi:phospholipase C
MHQNSHRYAKIFILVTLFCCGLSRDLAANGEIKRPQAWSDIEHVVIITLENGNPNNALNQPFLNYISKQGAYLSDFHAVTHPSQPNYIAMTAGSTFGVFHDFNVNLSKRHIGDLLEESNKTWKVYAENYPGNCYLGSSAGLYARKHVPFLSFKNVQSNHQRCQNITNAEQFAADLAADKLPDYSFYVPNLNNDGHNTNLAYADNWLKTAFGPIFSNTEIMKNTLFIITFDEDDFFHGNRIYTAFLGAAVRPGAYSSQEYDLYSLLKTIEEIFELGDLGRKDESADTILDIWR